MQSSADTTAADLATTERVKVLVPFGLAERQARFLAAAIRLLEMGTDTSRAAVEK